MGSYSIKPSYLPCWCFIMSIIENAGGFIIQDLRKFSGLNKSPVHLMVGSKVSRKK